LKFFPQAGHLRYPRKVQGVLCSWRTAFRQFGVNPTKVRCAAEALLRRLSKAGDISSINALVDIGNLISIRYALPVAIFDWRAVTGTVTVHPAVGNERFIELGAAEPVQPEPGEIIFADETDMVLARRWCWRQSAESAAQEDTTTIVITVEAHHANGAADVQAALHDLQQLLTAYVGGDIVGGVLNATQPRFRRTAHPQNTVDSPSRIVNNDGNDDGRPHCR
jgi:DNA/RNA-binding domain of Phe-tRNA-synthetase-like protein